MTNSITRRRLLGYGAGSLMAAGIVGSRSALGQGKRLVVGSLLDGTGPIALYGQAMIDGTTLAIEEINAAGGVLGNPLELRQYDTQSSIQKYTQYATQLALRDKVTVLMGGITSASREAVRPVINRHKIPYFYNVRYEGGVCDKYTFINGVTPSGQQIVLIPWAVKEFGKKIYTIAADYNYGQISAKWTKIIAKENGSEVIGEDFIPLDVSDFSTVISKIQAAKPDIIMSLLVGSNHEGFYRQYQSGGGKVPIISPTFQHAYIKDKVARPEYEGIYVAHCYFEEVQTEANKKLVAAWHKRFGSDRYVNDLAAFTYIAWKMWASAVNKAGKADLNTLVKTLEGGFSYEGPFGPIQYDKTHHIKHSVWLARSTGKQTYELIGKPRTNIAATDDQGRCDLIKNPNTFTQFIPSI